LKKKKKQKKTLVSGINPIEALSSIVALLTFRLSEQGTPTLVRFSAHEIKQVFLASSYSCTCHSLATM